MMSLAACSQVASEEPVFNAIVQWVKHDTAAVTSSSTTTSESTSRVEHLAPLLRHVRLPLLSAKYITDIVDEEVIIVFFRVVNVIIVDQQIVSFGGIIGVIPVAIPIRLQIFFLFVLNEPPCRFYIEAIMINGALIYVTSVPDVLN